jgi:hypothetical protein
MAGRRILDAKTRRQVERVAARVQDGDLCRALHQVGDDPVKSEIEDALREALDDATFRKVVAIFQLATAE